MVQKSTILLDYRFWFEFSTESFYYLKTFSFVAYNNFSNFNYTKVLYCLVRLAVNMVAAYLPFYLQETLKLEKKYISVVPLIQFISGFVVSFAMEPMSQLIGKIGTLLIGCVLLLVSNGIIQFVSDVPSELLYVLAITLGSGTSTMLIQTLVS